MGLHGRPAGPGPIRLLADPDVALRPLNDDDHEEPLSIARILFAERRWRELADLYKELSSTARQEQRHIRESRLLLAELAVLELLDDDARTADVQYFLALCHRLQTSFVAAESWLHRILARPLGRSTASHHAKAWRELAALREVTSRYADALGCVDRAVEVCTRFPGLELVHAQALLEGSVVRRLQGDLAGAQRTLQEARRVAGETDSVMLRGLVALREGGLMIAMGLPQNALTAYREAETHFAGVSRRNRDIARVRQVTCLRAIPRLHEAAQLAEELAQSFRRREDDYRLGQVLIELAEVREDLGDATAVAQVLDEAARIYEGQETLEALRWHLHSARVLRRTDADPVTVSRHLAVVLEVAGRPGRRDMTRTVSALHEVVRLPGHPVVTANLRRSAGRAAVLGAEAQRDALRRADDRGSVQSLREQVYSGALMTHLDDPGALAQIMDVGRADVLNGIFGGTAIDLTTITAVPATPGSEVLDAVYGYAGALADVLRGQRPAESVDGPGLPGRPLPQRWPGTDAVVGMQLVEVSQGWAMIHAAWTPRTGWSAELRKAGPAAARLLGRAAAGEPLPLRLLSSRVWAELGQVLAPRPPEPARGGRARMLLCPDPRLWRLPYAALPSGGGTVVDRVDLCVVPSLRSPDLLAARDGRGWAVDSAAAALLDPELPGHRDELAALAALPGGVVEVATLDAAADAGLLYVSGHGDRSGRSAALGPGALTLSTLAQADLPPVVVLNGCWSATADAGYGRDPLSLATGALVGGARSVIAGIGEIGGMATALVGAELVRRLGRGTPPAAALAAAQRAVRARHPLLGPLDWGGLVAVGLGW